MPAQTADGTHIITKGELLDMLAQFDDHERVIVRHREWWESGDILAALEDDLETLYGADKQVEREKLIAAIVDNVPNSGEWHVDRCSYGAGELVIHLA